MLKNTFKIDSLWYQQNWLSCLLLPFTWCYRLIIFLRCFFYQIGIFKTYHSPIPIIVVGNITVGGTGKTPLVIWLVDFLCQHGFQPAVISRGYKAKCTTFPHQITKDDSAEMVGDEALLIAKHCKCPVMISPKRVTAVKKLLANKTCNIIVSDDGLQHYALGRDIEIAVIDGARRFGNGFCLPTGPLREPQKRLNTVDFVVINGKTATKETGYKMQLQPIGFYDLKAPDTIQPPKLLHNQTVHAVAGIGNPERFFQTLRDLKIKLIPHPFPDHHDFSPRDLEFGDEKIIVMTEKDAVKCGDFTSDKIKPKILVLKVAAEMNQEFGINLMRKLQST